MAAGAAPYNHHRGALLGLAQLRGIVMPAGCCAFRSETPMPYDPGEGGMLCTGLCGCITSWGLRVPRPELLWGRSPPRGAWVARDGMGLWNVDGRPWAEAKPWRHVSHGLPETAISTPKF